MYGHQLNPNLPNPPAGSIAGGANTGLEDPFAADLLEGCAPQFCYVDDIQSYSTNEVAINWNSALAWIASFLADQGTGAPTPAGACRVDYQRVGQGSGAFLATVKITNTGRTTVNGWTVSWSFPTGQRLALALGADAGQQGPTVTARNLAFNRRIEPGRSVTFGLVAASPLANPAPELFRLNGSVCG
jgi:endoglucanase